MSSRPLSSPRRTKLAGWGIDLSFGIAAGLVVGAVLALNIIIYSGVDDGYRSSVRAVFEQRPWAGVLAGTAVILSPLVSVLGLRRIRHNRS